MTTLITGKTFPVKEKIKSLGGKWDADVKGWRVPDDKAAEAQALVDGVETGDGFVSRRRRSYYGGGCHTDGNCSSMCNPSSCPCGDGGWFRCC
jgi:hypothetical protein